MNDTEKKLDALIDALGFDVNKIQTGEVNCDCYKSNSASREYLTGCQRCQGTGIAYGVFDYKVTKRKPKELTFDKSGDVTAIPASAFAEAAKRDIARGIDTSSCDSSLQQLMRVFTEIKQ